MYKRVEKKQKTILGIDPGIADTGFGLLRINPSGTLECLKYGSIKTRAGGLLSKRLKLLDNELGKIIRQYKPDLMAVEELFFCKNVKTAITVGQARGVILLAGETHGLRITEFTPLQVKQAVSTYGQASKLQVQKMVKLILNLKTLPQPDDAADALAVAICASNRV